MKKYILSALILFTITATRAQDTTIVLSVHNTGSKFKLIPADFGTVATQNLVGTMLRSFDTVMVLKENGNTDTTGRKSIRYTTERRCDVMSQNLSGKVVVMELNKDCDVTQTCLNVQRAGAKAFVIIHNSNSQGNIKLPKKGLYKDSIRIPIFTVGRNVGDSITTLLPSVVGIQKRITTPPRASVVPNDQPIVAVSEKTKDKISDADATLNPELSNSVGFGKQGFSISPNPTHNQADVAYQFSKATDVTVEVKTASGQVIFSKILRGVSVGSLEIPTVDYPNGTYFVTLQEGKEVKTKKMVVRH